MRRKQNAKTTPMACLGIDDLQVLHVRQGVVRFFKRVDLADHLLPTEFVAITGQNAAPVEPCA
jgi:hypothetical protein